MTFRGTAKTLAENARLAASQGLYVPAFEHDNCGVGFIADVHGRVSHKIVMKALSMLKGLEHRGAVGADPLTGDGCGLMTQIPHRLIRRCTEHDFNLPQAGAYGVGMVFLSTLANVRAHQVELIEQAIAAQQLQMLGWRLVPTQDCACGHVALETKPSVWQFFVAEGSAQSASLTQHLYILRKVIEERAKAHLEPEIRTLYVCSLSNRTIVYKGLLVPDRISAFYKDLADPTYESAMALVHQRFSTNTFPSWERAHPYRLVAHNGEINTLRGNINSMRTRERLFQSTSFDDDINKLLPVIDLDGSDSAMFDNVLEMLTHTGRDLPLSLAMMIPPAWESDDNLPAQEHAFYRHHASRMEPWDGPALVAFCDGERIGACLDRNGLRPARYLVTTDGLVILASEAGTIDIANERIAQSGRLGPGQMLVVDTSRQCILRNAELKASLSNAQGYAQMNQYSLRRCDEHFIEKDLNIDLRQTLLSQQLFGYTHEDLRLVLGPMGDRGQEPLGAMGDDSALAVMSDLPQPLFNYFKQLFAQVTNPPIDPIREADVMSLRNVLGPQVNLFDPSDNPKQLILSSPVLSDSSLESLKSHTDFRVRTLDATFLPHPGGLRKSISRLQLAATQATRDGADILVISDRQHSQNHVPMPSLLALSTVHQHLIRTGLRQHVSLVVESGEPREVMHICLLLGYGASAVNPYLAFQSLLKMHADDELREKNPNVVLAGYRQALEKGILKVLSKMGISTLQSYIGAQIFEAVGLNERFIEEFFPNTVSRLSGIGLRVIEQDYLSRAIQITQGDPALDWGGRYKWRRDGERHQWTPNVVGLLQHGVRSADYKVFKKYTKIVDNHTTRQCDVRGLLDFTPANTPINLSEVEPAAEIVKRFRTGAMSFGSLSQEAHETLAQAMNDLGGRSNSGEGGEDPARYERGEFYNRNSAVKQVASGRFGVTPAYLLSAQELQIKMAQGAKPGEGGQLPGHKVDAKIAAVRHSTPGVGLISPPPHHDIYSIEDLAQLIFDLRNANQKAQISVKLVSEVGVGTVAAGVAKAKADRIVISGHSGGTGASPLSSIKHAGLPWELGLAEAQQTLVANNLRAQVTLETDGQLKTGRDVAIAAALGADNFGFGTAALIASGCILMRVCHRNTCPVGIATQDPELRKHFQGTPDHVMNFMLFVAEELREILASLGMRKLQDLIGRADVLTTHESVVKHRKAQHLDLKRLFYVAKPEMPKRHDDKEHNLLPEGLLDHEFLRRSQNAIEQGVPVEIDTDICNRDRATGTLLSSEIVRIKGHLGLPPATISITASGTAGQSFAAFLAPGVRFELNGVANDSLGKGMAGGEVSVIPPIKNDQTLIAAGNVALYGATGGRVFLRGRAGERFAVRNSGAIAVVEGLGAHGCEYMTGGIVVVLGTVGSNFAAGMSGGIAYIYDEHGGFENRCNLEMVDLENPSSEDYDELRALIEEHVDATHSTRGSHILQTWHQAQSHFVKVIPQEYRQALAQLDSVTNTAVAI